MLLLLKSVNVREDYFLPPVKVRLHLRNDADSIPEKHRVGPLGVVVYSPADKSHQVTATKYCTNSTVALELIGKVTILASPHCILVRFHLQRQIYLRDEPPKGESFLQDHDCHVIGTPAY